MTVRDESRDFEWHPTHAGKSFNEVQAALVSDLRHDQRSYHLALEAPDDHEQAMLARVLELERRWGIYEMDWYDAEPATLAETILEFEWEREQRRDLFSYAEYRASRSSDAATDQASSDAGPWWAFWRR